MAQHISTHKIIKNTSISHGDIEAFFTKESGSDMILYTPLRSKAGVKSLTAELSS